MNWIENICEPKRLILAWQAPDHTGVRHRWAIGDLTPSNGDLNLRYYEGNEFVRQNPGRTAADLERLGYRGYPGLRPKDVIHSGVFEAFRRRLPPQSRPDFEEYQKHFRISPRLRLSDFALLGYTEAKLPNDGFSVVNPLECTGDTFEYMLEVAGSRYYSDGPRPEVGAHVSFQAEPTNEHDPNAIMIMMDRSRIGYVNRLQASAVHRWIAECSVEATIERINGSAERPRIFVFVKVRPRTVLAAA